MKSISRIRKASGGFTLIELVIVIAVIAILAALLVPTILGQADRARISRAHGDVANIAKSIARLRADTGYTVVGCLTAIANLTVATGGGLTGGCGPGPAPASIPQCASATAGYVCYGGPYMENPSPADPWNTQYSVTLNTTTLAITVYSAGPDTTFGSADDVSYQQ